MKKYFFYTLLVLILYSCQKPLKNIDDYYPVIEMTAQVLDDGSVLVKGTYVNPGQGQIDKHGFSHSFLEDVDITQNQILINGNEDFSYTFAPIFSPDSTYYFKAFSVNAFGYVYSNTFKLSHIDAKPVIAPCSIPANRHMVATNVSQIFGFSGGVPDFDDITYSYTISQLTVYFTFRQPPKTGIYKITSYLDNDDYSKKEVLIGGGWQSFHVQPGADVYINRINVDSFQVEICNATVPVGSTNQSYKCNFTSPY